MVGVAAPVVLERGRGVVVRAAVELDHEPVRRPVQIDLMAVELGVE